MVNVWVLRITAYNRLVYTHLDGRILRTFSSYTINFEIVFYYLIVLNMLNCSYSFTYS